MFPVNLPFQAFASRTASGTIYPFLLPAPTTRAIINTEVAASTQTANTGKFTSNHIGIILFQFLYPLLNGLFC